MTTSITAPDTASDRTAPPYSRLVQVTAGACLVAAGLLNGLPQYLFSVLVGDLSFDEQIAWGATHETAQRVEQTLLLVSALVMPLGLLGLAQVTRWRAPRLTVVSLPLLLWGMWGFHNVLALGYVSGTVAPGALSVADAQALNDAYLEDPGVLLTALLPHLLGSFLGLLLLTIAAWRSRQFSRWACAAVIAFLAWDFFLPSYGALEPHLLLAIGWCWMGARLIRMPWATWRGSASV
jgi:hypothetical protein